ncbi:MAG: hypothetical protein ACAI38_04380 [Myxococcota bacterium]
MKRAMLCLLLVVAACKSEAGAVLQIVDVPSFNDDCTIPAAPALFQSAGTYDPSGGTGYTLALLLQNNANDTENPAAIPGDPDITPSANDAEILGYDYCFYRADTEDVTAYDPKGKGLPVECDDVSDDQRGFVTAGGNVSAGGGTRATSVRVLNLTALATLFGETFDPIALGGTFDDPVNLTTRSPAWGDFPAARSSRVNINVRARAKRQDGGTMRSNWFSFPVEVAPRLVVNQCVAAIVTCPGGGQGIQGQQIPASACGSVFSGAPLTCEDVDTCA